LSTETPVVSFWVYFSGSTVLILLDYALMLVFDSATSSTLNEGFEFFSVIDEDNVNFLSLVFSFIFFMIAFEEISLFREDMSG
jgi:hypothetical protein